MPALAPVTITSGTPAVPSWAALLEHFYAQMGRVVPPLERLKDDAVPQPYKSLLVHSADMTPTLENFFGQRLGLTVLNRVLLQNEYLREVALTLAGDSRPVLYGVIRIWLDHFPASARRLVLEEVRPLGNILQGEAIGHVSWPQAFFRLESDAHIGGVLRQPARCPLYGRRNVLLDGSRHLLAEVMEVLAPVNGTLMITSDVTTGLQVPTHAALPRKPSAKQA